MNTINTAETSPVSMSITAAVAAELPGFDSLATPFVDIGEQTDGLFEQLQDVDLFLGDLCSVSQQVESSSQQTNTAGDRERKPLPPRVISNRKAQQRFRQKQKQQKAAETSELVYLRQRVQQLEELVSRPPVNGNTRTEVSAATPMVSLLYFWSAQLLDAVTYQQNCSHVLSRSAAAAPIQALSNNNNGLLEAVGALRLEKTLLQVLFSAGCAVLMPSQLLVSGHCLYVLTCYPGTVTCNTFTQAICKLACRPKKIKLTPSLQI